MSAALAAEGENLTKLEKADVLELTVRHLHQLHRDGELFGEGGRGLPAVPGASTDRRRYQGGFLACAQQVASYIMKTPGLEPGLAQRLLAHLARCSQQLSPDPSAPLPPMPGPSGLLLESSPPPFVFPPPSAEYSITAQFQVFHEEESPSSSSSSSSNKRKSPSSPSSTLDFPPKKRFAARLQYDVDQEPAGPSRPKSSASDDGGSSSKEGGGSDPMWRPW